MVNEMGQVQHALEIINSVGVLFVSALTLYWTSNQNKLLFSFSLQPQLKRCGPAKP